MTTSPKPEHVVIYDTSTNPPEARYAWTGIIQGNGIIFSIITEAGRFAECRINFRRTYCEFLKAPICIGEISGESADHLNAIPTEKLSGALRRLMAYPTEWRWGPIPKVSGWFAVLCRWEGEDGMYPGVAFADDGHLDDPDSSGMIMDGCGYAGPFDTRAQAQEWASAHPRSR